VGNTISETARRHDPSSFPHHQALRLRLASLNINLSQPFSPSLLYLKSLNYIASQLQQGRLVAVSGSHVSVNQHWVTAFKPFRLHLFTGETLQWQVKKKNFTMADRHWRE
jgi:hypothetical protein